MFTFTGDHTNLRGTMPRGPVFCGLLIVLSLGAHHVAAAPPGIEHPHPPDGTAGVAHNVDLSWPASSGRRSFDVYFGLAEEAIAGAKRSCLHHKSAQTEARFDPGPLAPNTTYYWRVDTIEPNGVVHAGPVWSFTTTYGKYEGKLEGCCKWLLHLGQNPTDGFLAGINPLHIEWYVAPRPQTGVKPCPGLPCDTLRNFTDATQPILVWTPQCSGTGVFGDNPSDGETQQIYLVYIGSPSERHAQLRTKHIRSLHAWNNGRLLFQHQGTGYPTVEHVFDFVLFEGANMPVLDSVGNAEMKEHLTAWITDTQGSEYADLTYSLAPPPEARGTRVRRILPDSQGSVDKIDVSLDVRMDPNDKPSRLKIVEYIPAGTSVADAGGGTVLTNAIQWSLSAADVVPTHIRYTLGKASDIAERTAFCGYFYDGKALADVGGDSVVFAATLESPVEMAGRISTVVLPAEQLKTDRYTKGQNVDVGRLADNLPLYPVERRWDWTHPFTLSTLPNLLYDVAGSSALVAHVRTVQENLVDDQEQFRVLPNLVLPIFLSYYDAPRLRLTLTADAQPGDERLRVARHLPYGATGNPVDGLPDWWYVRVGDDLLPMRGQCGPDQLEMALPISKSYPKGTPVVPWYFYEELELECQDVLSLLMIGAAAREPAVLDEVMFVISETLSKEDIFLPDGSFKNEPGSYGDAAAAYPLALLKAQVLFGPQATAAISSQTMDRMHQYLLHACAFPFSHGSIPHLNNGGCWNQLGRSFWWEDGVLQMLERLFPEDTANVSLFRGVFERERQRVPGDVIGNVNFKVDGWGYAMLRSENGSWDRGMETLLSSKHLLSDPGDHVSRDCLGIVLYGLGAILTPRYGYHWVGYLPPFLNQMMIDEKWQDFANGYYGSFWHFDGRPELPSAVAHTGDGDDCSMLDVDMSRWCIQFPEYLFDAYFVQADDGRVHQYDWSFINMGEMTIVEPAGLMWEPCDTFLAGYWGSDRGGGPRLLSRKPAGRIAAEWKVSNQPWVPNGDPTLLRFTPAHSGRLRLTMADDTPGDLINAQIGYTIIPIGEQSQANSEDILVVRKRTPRHTFVTAFEPVPEDRPEPYVRNVEIVEAGKHLQRLAKVTTAEGEDWVYMSGQWAADAYGQPPSVTTDADMVVWRLQAGQVTRVYLANGSYATTPAGHWQFESRGNHYWSSQK